MKILHVNQSDLCGGAARAAYRIHSALCRNGLDSWMGVNRKVSDDWKVFGPRSRFEKALIRLRPAIGSALLRMLKTENKILHSTSLFSSSWPKRQNEFKPDILNLHWICGEMLSIHNVGRLRNPVVWTLHDMWPFCGAEHYTDDFRWRDGYFRANRPRYESGFDLNRWVWERKRKHWTRPLHIVTPSRWLAQCVQQSVLMRGWPVTLIPNAIDTDVWAPIDQRIARSLLGLPRDEPLLLFGAMKGGQEPIKGFDLLVTALQYLVRERKDLHLVIFGESAPREPVGFPFPTHYMGRLHDDVALRLLYSAADVMVIPSRRDNLPNTGVESLSCGTPVVAFDTCGLPDIVDHKQTGYLAKPFDTEDLAAGINWVLGEVDKKILDQNARNKALKTFSSSLVAAKYIELYEDILSASA